MKKRCKSTDCHRKPEGTGSFCSKCRYKKRKEKDLHKWAYETIKRNARRRGVPFSISLEYFTQFCYSTQILVGRGRTKDSYSIDRKINELGYVEGNLQVLTVSENSSKKQKVLEYDWYTRKGLYRKIEMTEIDDEFSNPSPAFEIYEDDLPF